VVENIKTEEKSFKQQASSSKLQAAGSRRDPDFLKQKKI